ncbi:MAG: histidine kinase dimerization/phosphoacceptor domain -containing protein [Alkalilacustris sp.]
MATSDHRLPLRLGDRLAVRLAVLLTVALLPLGTLAVLTTLESLRTDERSAERALIGMTSSSEAGRHALVESALTAARTLARPTLERLDQPEACRALLADTVDRAGVFGFAGFTDTDGRMNCASAGEPLDFSDSPVFRELMEDPRALVRRMDRGAVTGNPVLVATHPVFEEGTLRGFLSVTIAENSVAWLGGPMGASGGPGAGDAPPQKSVLLNRWGEILTTEENGAHPHDSLPVGIDLQSLTADTPAVFSGRTEGGRSAVFVVVTLVPGQLHVLGVWDPEDSGLAGLGAAVPPMLFTLTMWLASLGIVYVALHYLVIRHLRHLGRQMRRFTLESGAHPAPLPDRVSGELRDLQSSFLAMAALVTRDGERLARALADREAALAEKTLLLKEVHHRVKNNLQLIASILNLQMRRLRDTRTRRVLQNVQDRVISLATIHRNLYQSDELSALHADHLIDELLRHLFALGTDGDTGIALEVDLAPVTLEADQLVPLSLLLTEAATNALKYAGPAGGQGRAWVRVTLREAQGEVVLRLTNSLAPSAAQAAPDELDHPSTGLGSELIVAFAAQLGAELDHGLREVDGASEWAFSVRFKRTVSEGPIPTPCPAPPYQAPSSSEPVPQS